MSDVKQKSQAHGLTYPFETLPTAENVVEVAPGVYWIRMSLPYSLDHINLWLLEDEDGWTVVDTCVDMDSSRQQWEHLFAGFMGGKPIKNVIVTHMHPDHVGLAGWLVKRFDAQFYMSRTDYLMCRVMAADTGRKAPEEAMRFYKAAGFEDKSLARYQERFGGFGEHIHDLPQAYRRLQQGDEMRIGKNTWRIEVGSGHAPEHICLYCEDLKLLISGDQVIPRISSNVSLFPTEPFGNPLQDWIDSCARLISVLPSDLLVLPAHNEPFYGLHERLNALINGHEKSLARLIEVCAEPQRAVDKAVFSCLFKRPIGADVFFMATGESLSHLMCLVHRGDLKMQLNDDGVCYFSKQAA
ncbi:MBL fold metallo-hydrolase [Alphaproteobacteria bacterium]|nr:MBL fold metallo-hydrolase [Alphaproteobacteria bacterium]MDC0131517.1 MBL fold metallo-hydrolase [Alphaproteobacteria bacterium]MDC1241010.1 MBL fold metallo-hydrolase [bacterium]